MPTSARGLSIRFPKSFQPPQLQAQLEAQAEGGVLRQGADGSVAVQQVQRLLPGLRGLMGAK